VANATIKNFLGLRVGVADPELGAANIFSNFRRDFKRGQLTLVNGFTDKYVMATADFDMAAAPIPLDFAQFFIPDNGGRAVTAVLAKYTRNLGAAVTGETVAAINTAGIFIRPYYNGSAWVDAWIELTEFHIFLLNSAAGSVVTFKHTAAFPSFAADYFKGFTLIRSSLSELSQTGFLIRSSVDDTVTIEGTDTDLTEWSTTVPRERLFLMRSVLPRLIPQTVTNQFRNILDELRVTTGPETADVNLAMFYRDQKIIEGSGQVDHKGTMAETGVLEFSSLAWQLDDVSLESVTEDGLPEGEYRIKSSLVTDDGQETELRDSADFGFVFQKVTQTQLFVSPAEVTTDGTYLYTYSNPSGAKPILYKIDIETKSVISSTTLSVTNGSEIHAITFDGGFLYVAYNDKVGGINSYVVVSQFTAGLLSTGNGWFKHAVEFNAIEVNIQSALISNGLAVFKTFDGAEGDDGSIIAVTLNSFVHTSIDGIADLVNRVLATDGARIFLGNASTKTVHVYQTPLDDPFPFVPFDITISEADGVPQSGIIVTGVLYVGAGESIVQIDLSDYSHSVFVEYGGHTLISDGTYLLAAHYVAEPHIRLFRIADATLVGDIEGENLFTNIGFRGTVTNSVFYLSLASGEIGAYGISVNGNTFTSHGFTKLKYKVLVSPGLWPRRGKEVKVYISKDDAAFYLAAIHDVTTSGIGFDSSSTFHATLKHRYFKSEEFTITKAEFDLATSSYISEAGRKDNDSGVTQYGYGITANRRSYIINRLIGDRPQRNKVFTSAESGDAVPMYDVFPNDARYILDVEDNDGDYILALGNVADRVLVLKSGSLMLLTPVELGHNKDVVAIGIGIAGIKSLAKYNDFLYWLDHSGVWEFSTNGLRIVSTAINSTLLGYTAAQREAAIATVDQKNALYRLQIASVIYVLDLRDGEWTIEAPSATSLMYTREIGFGTATSTRRYVQISVSSGVYSVQTPNDSAIVGIAAWESADIQPPMEKGFDVLLDSLFIEFSQSSHFTSVTLELYLDQSTSAAASYDVKSSSLSGIAVPSSLAARCKTFRLRLTATSNSASALMTIKRVGAYFTEMPVGGDQQTWV
jgi:hypothetical protein